MLFSNAKNTRYIIKDRMITFQHIIYRLLYNKQLCIFNSKIVFFDLMSLF